MSDSIESKGTTVDEAVSEALLQLGATKAEVEVTVIDEGKSGFLGFFGGRPAIVKVERRGGGQSAGAKGRSRGRQGDRSSRRPASRGGNRRPENQSQAKPVRQSPKPGHVVDGNRRPSGGNNRGNTQREPRDGNSSRRSPAPREFTKPRQEEDKILQEATKALSHAEAVRDVSKEEIPATLEMITKKVMDYGAFPCRVDIILEDYVQVKIFTDDNSAGVLIGRHGATIDAVEHLVERMASQAAGERAKMNLDINNYRRRREGELAEQVDDLMAKARETGKDVHMEPLCARERRMAHMKVAEDDKLRTYTLSSSGGKYVVIALEKNEKVSADSEREMDATDA